MHSTQLQHVTFNPSLTAAFCLLIVQASDDDAFAHIRDLVESSPTEFWEPIAQRELHWLNNHHCAWLTHTSDAQWMGWHAETAELLQLGVNWLPWRSCCDETESPIVRWFHGGQTNAVFNEVDRHVLQMHTEATAFLSDPGDGTSERMSLGQLALESVLAAWSLIEDYGLVVGQRIAFYLPNDYRATAWIEAAKRVGLPYIAVASGTAGSSLANRIVDTTSTALVTSGGLVVTAQQALALTTAPPKAVVIPPCATTIEGCDVATDVLLRARERLLQASDGVTVESLPPDRLIRALWRLTAPTPLDACFPLFILYTSGSTGKPKGIVHTHGGYEVGLCLTTQVIFDLQSPRDIFLVIATPGWITGQSYMIAAALLCHVPSVLLDGSPVSPPDRFAATIERHHVSVLKAGSTFLRMLMTMPGGDTILGRHDLRSLRLGTFCAEPVNEAVHHFAATHVTPAYINSYWATEHGGIVWSRCHGNSSQPLLADTRTWPLPWIAGDVLVRSNGDWRVAAAGEQGEVVIRRRYPYQALTVWQSEGFDRAEWRGDMQRWGKYFEQGLGYVQGDAAIRHTDGAFTFHGRSDEVINVGGNRIGTEEIESALLVDTERTGSPLRNCAVVGMPDEVLGTVPVAFLVLQAGATLSVIDEGRLRALVQSRLGSVAVPAMFIVADALPETYSGKFMRRLLQLILTDAPLGDLGAVKNPDCVEPLQHAVRVAIAPASAKAATQALATVLDIVRSLTAVEQISPSTPLMKLGIDSLSVAHFVASLQKKTGLQLSPTLIFEHSTADAVAQHLVQISGEGCVRAPFEMLGGVEGRSASAPPAIVAIIGRWPVGAYSRNSFWRLAGSDAVREVPAQRWSIGPRSNEHMLTSRYLATVHNAELFDSQRFAISPAEAAAMDPQQRLLLERGYEALCSGGFLRSDVQGGDTGVFLGITNADYAALLSAGTSVYTATGGAISIAAGRLSFALGLQGPCESIDTACSSALAALHGAAVCIGAGDCAAALTTAVTLMLAPHVSVSYARAGMLSADGRCKTFDASANGYVRGEGVGGLVIVRGQQLKATASVAVALIGSAVRQDGTSASLTAPNGSAQATLLGLAGARAAADGALHRGVESHGTGTPLGDPTEVRALSQALPAQQAERALGGVKANVGHLEPAAGMVGLMASASTLLERRAAPNAQLRAVNAHLVPSVGTDLNLLTAVAALRKVEDAYTGTSAFGYSGTIAHAVLAAEHGSIPIDLPRPTRIHFRRWTAHCSKEHWASCGRYEHCKA